MLMVGMLILSACNSGTPTPTPTDVATESAFETEETETAVEVTKASTGEDPVSGHIDIVQGDPMPCATIYDSDGSVETRIYQDIVDQLPPVGETDWVKGNPDAPVTLIEYADFQCPACASFEPFINSLLEQYPDTFRVVFRHLPLPSIHPLAFISAMAAEAAGAQGLFWEFGEFLYTQQSVWSGLSESDFSEWVVGQAEMMGMDPEQFELDLLDEEKRAELESQTNEYLSMGMNYIPFVIHNGKIMRSYYTLTQYILVHNLEGYDTCPAWVVSPTKTYTAKINTDAGEILVDLDLEGAPLAVNSFVFLARNGWFENVKFYNVVEGFIAQAGDVERYGPGFTVPIETGSDLSFESGGVLGMLSTGTESITNHFFITLGAAATLDGHYSAFGRVQENSMDILNDIVVIDASTNPDLDNATVIHSVEIIEN